MERRNASSLFLCLHVKQGNRDLRVDGCDGGSLEGQYPSPTPTLETTT
jgi:hypothetical protein